MSIEIWFLLVLISSKINYISCGLVTILRNVTRNDHKYKIPAFSEMTRRSFISSIFSKQSMMLFAITLLSDIDAWLKF